MCQGVFSLLFHSRQVCYSLEKNFRNTTKFYNIFIKFLVFYFNILLFYFILLKYQLLWKCCDNFWFFIRSQWLVGWFKMVNGNCFFVFFFFMWGGAKHLSFLFMLVSKHNRKTFLKRSQGVAIAPSHPPWLRQSLWVFNYSSPLS